MRAPHWRNSTAVIDTSCLLFLDHLDLLLDRGEAETIVQARERKASTVLMDDLKGRLVASRHTVAVRGTLGLLKEFRQIRIIGPVQPLIKKLQNDLGYRIDLKTLKQVLEELEES